MNVIVSNRQKEIIDNANIDAIKDLNGLFNVNDLITKFKNYFFSKMILDATSIVDFATRDVLTTLANEIGPERLIILLPSNPEPPLEFKKLLIELKIYNFTNNIDDVIKFIEKPNTYEDAIKLIDDSFSSDVYVDNSIKEQDSIPSEETDDNNDSDNIMTNDEQSLGDILNRFNLKDSPVVNETVNGNIEEQEIAHDDSSNQDSDYDAYNDTMNMFSENLNVTNNVVDSSINNSENRNTFLISDDFDNTYDSSVPKKTVIGVKNITLHAGSTSLIYMLHKMVAVNMKKSVLSIEIGKNDFRLFRDNKMISVNEDNVEEVINNSHEEVIFVDLNDYDEDICSDILYLVEPSTIKLNGLMATNKNVFNELKNKKVLLNKSLLSSSDVNTLEGEAGIKFFFSIEPLNDRIFNDAISRLLNLLNIK